MGYRSFFASLHRKDYICSLFESYYWKGYLLVHYLVQNRRHSKPKSGSHISEATASSLIFVNVSITTEDQLYGSGLGDLRYLSGRIIAATNSATCKSIR